MILNVICLDTKQGYLSPLKFATATPRHYQFAKIVRLPSPDPGFARRVGRSGFFCFGEGQFCSQGFTAC